MSSFLLNRSTTIAIAIVVRAIIIIRAIKERSKELILKIKPRRLGAITLQGAIKKSLILLVILEKLTIG